MASTISDGCLAPANRDQAAHRRTMRIRLVNTDYSHTIAQLRHAFLFSAMSTAKDPVVLFNPVPDDVRATMRASRCEGLDCTFKVVKGVSAAV